MSHGSRFPEVFDLNNSRPASVAAVSLSASAQIDDESGPLAVAETTAISQPLGRSALAGSGTPTLSTSIEDALTAYGRSIVPSRMAEALAGKPALIESQMELHIAMVADLRAHIADLESDLRETRASLAEWKAKQGEAMGGRLRAEYDRNELRACVRSLFSFLRSLGTQYEAPADVVRDARLTIDATINEYEDALGLLPVEPIDYDPPMNGDGTEWTGQ